MKRFRNNVGCVFKKFKKSEGEVFVFSTNIPFFSSIFISFMLEAVMIV